MNVLKTSSEMLTRLGVVINSRQHPDKRVRLIHGLIMLVIVAALYYLYLTT